MNVADQSYVQQNKKGEATTFVGPDAVNLFACAAVKSGIGLWIKTGMIPNRSYTISNMLKFATRHTGKKYKRSKDGATQAAADLGKFIDNLKASLPYLDHEGKPT